MSYGRVFKCFNIGHVAGTCPSTLKYDHYDADHKNEEITCDAIQCVSFLGGYEATFKDLRKEVEIC